MGKEEIACFPLGFGEENPLSVLCQKCLRLGLLIECINAGDTSPLLVVFKRGYKANEEEEHLLHLLDEKKIKRMAILMD